MAYQIDRLFHWWCIRQISNCACSSNSGIGDFLVDGLAIYGYSHHCRIYMVGFMEGRRTHILRPKLDECVNGRELCSRRVKELANSVFTHGHDVRCFQRYNLMKSDFTLCHLRGWGFENLVCCAFYPGHSYLLPAWGCNRWPGCVGLYLLKAYT